VDFKKLPKISLHDHLDGGLRPQTILEIADEIGYQLPEKDEHGLATWFYQSSNSGSLERYLTTFDHTLAVMQKPEHLRRIATEAVLDLHEDGVIYAELRWAPEQNQHAGLSLQEAVDAVQDGLEEGMQLVEAMGGFIRTGQIICAMRQGSRSLEIAELAVANRNDGVVGFDIAGPEKGFPASLHKVAFDYLASELMPVTVHAGEADGLDSIKDALVSGRALRIGHGINLIEDVMLTRTEGDTDLVPRLRSAH
jgi:Adenosine deaminase